MYEKLLVKQILEKAKNYKWSIQGLGMLRLYLSDNVRLHIWDPAFQIKNVSPLHDHPWDFDSLVIAGAVRQNRYTILDKAATFGSLKKTTGLETYSMATIKCGAGACVMSPKETVWLQKLPTEFYAEGQSYSQIKEEIHESLPLSGTVTIVNRMFNGNRELARVLWKDTAEFVSAEPRPATDDEIECITKFSLKRWFSEAEEADNWNKS